MKAELGAFGLVLVATGNAAAQTGGWLLVRERDRQGHPRRQRAPPDGDRRHLPDRGGVRLAAAGRADPRARRPRPADGARAPPRSLRSPHGPVAPLLLAAEGGLDHRAADERRRRGLGRPLAGDADARRQRDPAARRGDRAADRRLAARPRRLRDRAARARPDALVPAHVARRARSRRATASPSSPRRSPSRSPEWRSCRRSTGSARSRRSSTS